MIRKELKSFRLWPQTLYQLDFIVKHTKLRNRTLALELAVKDAYERLFSDLFK